MEPTAFCDSCPGCLQESCATGYYGDSCAIRCDPNCRALACAKCACAVCSNSTGACLNGCDSGWYGATCDTICPDNCFQQNLVAVTCDQSSGDCVFGCSGGFYGPRCNNTCDVKCLRSMCDQDTSKCTQGCIHGYEGDYCNVEAGGFATDQIAGAAGGAFVVILWGVIVIILICVIWRRRQKEHGVFNRNEDIDCRHSPCNGRRRLHDPSSCYTTMLHDDHQHHIQEGEITADGNEAIAHCLYTSGGITYVVNSSVVGMRAHPTHIAADEAIGSASIETAPHENEQAKPLIENEESQNNERIIPVIKIYSENEECFEFTDAWAPKG